MTDRELMQQALASLEGYARNCRCEGGGGLCDAGKALRARLAQPEPDDGYCTACEGDYCTAKDGCVARDNPPPQREWQGLTIDELVECKADAGQKDLPFACAIEAKLKEKNA